MPTLFQNDCTLYIPISSSWEFQLLLAVPVLGMAVFLIIAILVSVYRCFMSHLYFILGSIVVLICTSFIMLSIFSCVYLLFLHPIWHLCQIQVHSDILSVFLEMSQLQLFTLLSFNLWYISKLIISILCELRV